MPAIERYTMKSEPITEAEIIEGYKNARRRLVPDIPRPPFILKDRVIDQQRELIKKLLQEINALRDENEVLKNPQQPAPPMPNLPELPVPPATQKVRSIVVATCRHYGISYIDIMAPNRSARFVLPRQVAMYVAKKQALKSLPEIGRYFCNRDHTTVMHAIRKIGGMVDKGEPIIDDIREIYSALGILP